MSIETKIPNLENQKIIAESLKTIAAKYEDNYLDKFYPINSVYISSESTSPADLFGGTWEQLDNLYSDPDYSKAKITDANEGVALTVSQDCLAIIWCRNAGGNSQNVSLLINGVVQTMAFAPGININNNWYVYFGMNIALQLKKGDVISSTGSENQRTQLSLTEIPYKITNYRWKRTA